MVPFIFFLFFPSEPGGKMELWADCGLSSGHSDNDYPEAPSVNVSKKSKSKLYAYMRGHPLVDTHGAHWSKNIGVPDFVGGSLPCCDQGNCEYYCSTMLTLFKPWRSGLDLKTKENSWDDAFESYQFLLCQLHVMRNMNLQYECLDAHDDFHAQRKVLFQCPAGLSKVQACSKILIRWLLRMQ
ncbi:hypothetical protein L208DRAFT_1518717 [Tricholoma matsutake]|nr:hypothetical protein L208DRAFT_1518717 [Tricholoma matsutake 945]